MTLDEAIAILEEVKELDDSIYQYNIKYLKAFEIAIKALKAWNNLFKSYEVLVDNITDLTATEATERINKWCIEQLRGILGDYYADKMEKEILEAQADGDDYKYIKSISNPTGIEFDIDIPKEIESYEKLLKHPVVKHIMDMDEEQEQIDFVQPHKKVPVTLAVGSGNLISRRALQEWIKDKSFGDIVVASEHNFDCLPSIKPQESCENTISSYDKLIDLANAIESDDSGYWTNKKISSALRNISSIKPQLFEDAISRQAVMDYIHRILNQGTGKKKSFEFIQKYVEKLPSIKPQVQTGYWIFEGDQCFSCSSCGRIYTQKAFEYLKLHKNDSDFPNNCPNCGVRMESEKNE